MSSAGYIASSFTSNIYTLYVTYGALPGFGLVMISLASLVTVGHHFDEHQALAMGICQSGGSVGGFIFNPLLQALIESYGWRGALLIFVGILLHGALFGLGIYSLKQHKNKPNTETSTTWVEKMEIEQERIDEAKPFIPIHNACKMETFETVKQTTDSTSQHKEMCDIRCQLDNKITLLSNDESLDKTETLHSTNLMSEGKAVTSSVLQVSNDNQRSTSKTDKFLEILHQIIPYKVFTHRPTCIILTASHVRSFGFFVPFMLLPDLAKGKGIVIDDAAWLASGIGISGAVSRVVLGWVGGFPSVNRLYLYISCILIGGILTAICPLLSVYWMLMIYACVFGWLMGGEVSLTPVICSDVAGKDKLPEVFGMLRTLCGIGALLGTPLSGWLFEKTGDYGVSFILAGVLITLSGFLLLLLLKYQRK